MIRPRGNRAGRGFTLIELLIAIGIINIILVLGGLCFAEIVRMRGARDRYYERLAAAQHLLHLVERDVKGAREIVDAGESKLILRSETGEVVYLVKEGAVRRIEKAADKTRDEVVANAPRLRVRFDLEGQSAPDARTVATTVEWEENPQIGISRPTLSLRVALRERGQPL